MVILCVGFVPAFAQIDSGGQNAQVFHPENLNSKLVDAVSRKYQTMEKKLASYSERSLKKLQRQEQKIQKKLSAKDSVAARQLSEESQSKYAHLLQEIKNSSGKFSPSLKNYVPGLDSIQTTFMFLDKSNKGLSMTNVEKIKQIKAVSDHINQLQLQLQSADVIKQFIKERRQQLKQQLDSYGLDKELRQFNKQVYYYQEQVREYNNLLHDPEKVEQKILGMVRETPAFKDFMAKSSLFAQLFPIPAGYGTDQALQGLQTRIAVQQQLSQRLAGAGANPQQYLQQQVQQAQSALGKLKDKANQMGGGSGDLEIPDFKPNQQKTKTFWKRLEYGLSIQSQKTNPFLPTTSDIVLTTGYRLNDKSTIGLGAGFKLGWGKNIKQINLTAQGMSLRSFLDIKLKGSIWISGGYEENYQQEFAKIDQLKNVNAWQKSGLLGLTRKYKIGKKKGNLQLLWDFLSYSQLPATQPLKFRIGYTF